MVSWFLFTLSGIVLVLALKDLLRQPHSNCFTEHREAADWDGDPAELRRFMAAQDERSGTDDSVYAKRSRKTRITWQGSDSALIGCQCTGRACSGITTRMSTTAAHSGVLPIAEAIVSAKAASSSKRTTLIMADLRA